MRSEEVAKSGAEYMIGGLLAKSQTNAKVHPPRLRRVIRPLVLLVT
eukprot:COSAG06_NODE_774_length_12424_cov_35.268014_18_plen_46_part_00